MKHQKLWLTVQFYEGDAYIELDMNYHTKKFVMRHGSNDNNVTFNADNSDFKTQFDRLKCVAAALKFAKQELGEE